MAKCGSCDAEWSGLGIAHCKQMKNSGCCETFGSDYAFDRHRTKDFKCIPVSKFGDPYKETGKPILVVSSSGYWVSELKAVGYHPDDSGANLAPSPAQAGIL